MMNYRLRDENARKRDEYLSSMKRVIEQRKQRAVYMDESYVHQNYARHDDSFYDPNDEQDLEVTIKNKGRRYCFVAAIVDADPRVPDAERQLTEQAFLMRESLDIFEGGKKQTKDYHGMFDSVYFERWMGLLLDTLDAYKIRDAIIVLDNAKYHKRLPDGTPKGTMKKAEMQAKCTELGIPFEQSDLRKVLWGKLKMYVRDHVDPVIATMARARGHTVRFTPPHHSDLQPIETVWAIVKGEVGRQYTSATTFKEVRDRLEVAFARLQATTVQGCIDKTNSILLKMHAQVAEGEDTEDTEEEEDSGHSETQSNCDSDSEVSD